VAKPSVLRHGRERHEDITQRRPLLPVDLLADPAYGIESLLWDSFGYLKWDLRRRSGFLGMTTTTKALRTHR
jgi:hypothetical protein